MIADAPLSASSRFDDLSQAVKAYVATAKVAAADGLTWAEFGELLVGLLRLSVRMADVLQLPGEEKKALVLLGAAALFDAIADKAIPVTLWPVWLLVRSPIRSLVLSLAAGAVEQILPLVRAA